VGERALQAAVEVYERVLRAWEPAG
jgi:hypothetical protein